MSRIVVLKTKVLLLVLIHGLSGLLAQTPKIEQLRNEVKSHTQEDTFRVNRINELAFELRNKIPGEASSLYQKALTLSKTLNYNYGEAMASLGLGFYYRFRMQDSQAITYTQDALRKFQVAGDTISQVTC